MKAQGIAKKVSYKKETTFGELPGVSGAKQLRRTSADFNLTKENFSSNELSTHRMNSTLRHGVRSADGSLAGELSPGSYADFLASVVARDWTAVVGTASAEVTIAASGTNFTITRTAGDYLTDGFLVGQVVRMTGAGLNAANVGNNLLVLGVTATVLTVQVLSATALVAEGPISTVAIAPAGKITYTPMSGHTDDSYTLEEFYSDISESVVFGGMKPANFNVTIPASGLVTTDMSFMGKGISQSGNTEYFTSSAPVSTTDAFTAVQGTLLVNGSAAGCITDISVAIARAQEMAQCIGSNDVSEIFTGKITVTGSLSAYFSDATLRNYFDDESEVTIVVALTTGEEKDADVMSFAMSRVKFTNSGYTDAELGVTQSLDFEALLMDTNTNGLAPTNILVQDTSLV